MIEAFERLIDRERLRLQARRASAALRAVNSATAFVESLVLEEFDCSATTPHSRVRRATVKLRSSHEPRASRNRPGAIDCESAPVPLDFGSARLLRSVSSKDFPAFGDGWAFPDVTSIWTRGERAEILLDLRQARPGRHRVEISFGRVGARPGQALTVTLSIDGKPVSQTSLRRRHEHRGLARQSPARGDGRARLHGRPPVRRPRPVARRSPARAPPPLIRHQPRRSTAATARRRSHRAEATRSCAAAPGSGEDLTVGSAQAPTRSERPPPSEYAPAS